jgi:hypothetical protein
MIILLICFFAAHLEAALTGPAQKLLTPAHAPATFYVISVEIDPVKLTYSGHQKITFTNRQEKSTNYLLLFMYPNDPGVTKSEDRYFNVDHIQVNGKPAKSEEKGPSLRIYLDEALQPGQQVTTEFDFQGTIPQQSGNRDIFSEAMDQLQSIMNPSKDQQPDYGIFSSSKEILNLGLWYAALSKYDRDGWDEEAYSGIGDVSYFDPASFKVTLIAPANYQVVTTGTTLKKIPLKNNRLEHQMEAPMSRDFVVELSDKYEQRSAISGLTAIRSFFLSKHRGSGEKVLETAVKAFGYYSTRFGSYPYSELDVVESPLYGGAGGVEFPGLVTISSMLYKDDQTTAETGSIEQLLAGSPAFDQLLEFVVAHEVAHQWWNAIVGSNSKKYPFIDEAMANYSAVLYFENFHGRETAERQMAMQMKLNYQMHRFMGGADQPVILPASAFNGPLEYSAIVYGKGALGFDRIRTVMGDRSFFTAMKEYYNRFWFKIAGPEDFKQIAQETLPARKTEIAATFQRWMNEQHGDEDIGPGTFDALFATMMEGNDSGTELGVDEKELLKKIEELLKQPPP